MFRGIFQQIFTNQDGSESVGCEQAMALQTETLERACLKGYRLDGHGYYEKLAGLSKNSSQR